MFWFDFFVALFGLFSSPDKKRTEAEAPVPLSEIADVAMLQAKYFCRFFKKCMGVTFLEYQNEIRLSRIYDDIINTDDQISHILERHGFTNYKLFRRMFRERFGCTPTKLRNGSLSAS